MRGAASGPFAVEIHAGEESIELVLAFDAEAATLAPSPWASSTVRPNAVRTPSNPGATSPSTARSIGPFSPP